MSNETKNGATSETTPRHIWMHHVELEVAGKVPEGFTKHGTLMRARMSRAYNAGEPVWMVVEEVIHRAKYTQIAQRGAEFAPITRAFMANLRAR